MLDLSWDQIAAVVNCTIAYKVEQANMITQGIAGALGGKVERPSHKRRTPDRAKKAKSRENALLGMFAKHGFSV